MSIQEKYTLTKQMVDKYRKEKETFRKELQQAQQQLKIQTQIVEQQRMLRNQEQMALANVVELRKVSSQSTTLSREQ